MTPKEYKQMMDYLTRSGIKDQVKFASDIDQPVDKFEVQQIKLFNRFNRDYPNKKADGGRIGFNKGLRARTDYTQGEGTDTFTKAQKNKIKKAFNISDAAFEKSGTKFGVPTGFGVPGEEGKALRRKYALIKDFVNRGFKEGSQTLASGLLRKEDQLPLKIQTEIKTKYELPEDYINTATGKREWDFKRFKYGVPAKKGTPLRSLARKIQYEFTRDPITKKFKFVGDFKTPNGWMMAQMYRSGVEQGSGNYEPVFGKVNNTKKIVGFKDNIVGDTFYVRDEFVKPGGKPMRLHPDFNNVKKFVDVANKANAPLNKTLTGLLKKIGVEDNRMTMTTLLNYLAKEEGFQATNRALVLHHKGGVGANATKDLQLLRNINNNAIQAAENRIRSVVNLGQTPDKKDIKILKDNRARIIVGDQTFGAGPQTAKGAFRSYEKFIESKLKRGEIDPKALTKFAESQFKNQVAILGGGNCGRGFKNQGGRVGLQDGTPNVDVCFKNAKQRINSGFKNATPAEARNYTKLLNAVKGSAVIGKNLLKFGIVPEALYVGADSLIRMGYGDTFKEAGLRAADFFIPGDQTQEADRLKVQRTLGDAAATNVGRVFDYRNQIANIDSLEKQKQNFESLSGGGAFDYVGDLSQDIKNIDTRLNQAKNDLQNKFMVSEAETVAADRALEEAYDISKAKSPLARLKSFAQNIEAVQDDPFLSDIATPQKTQIDLNLNMFPPMQTDFMKMTDTDIINRRRQLANMGVQDLPSSRQLMADRDKEIADMKARSLLDFGREQAFGTQGTFFGQPLAGGGIAKLAGVSSGPPPESGPNSQGLQGLMKRVKKL